jgi:hypothetical protein
MRYAAPQLLLLLLAGCGGGPDRAGAPPNESRPAEVADARASADLDTSHRRPSPASPAGAATNPAADTAALPGWTTGITREDRPVHGVATVTAVRFARHPGFERMVVEFAGARIPGYAVEYVDEPVHQCGSGDAVQLRGDAVLQLRLEPARAHDDNGVATLSPRRWTPGFPVVLEALLTCDFEAQVEVSVGVGSPNSYRTMELSGPARLVVDIRSD